MEANMSRMYQSPQITWPRRGVLATFFSAVFSVRSEANTHASLDQMPRDRLADLGIAPRTEANFRSSGERGRIPQAQLW
jgi:hypothetical protein